MPKKRNDPCIHCVHKNTAVKQSADYQLDNFIYMKLQKLYAAQRNEKNAAAEK